MKYTCCGAHSVRRYGFPIIFPTSRVTVFQIDSLIPWPPDALALKVSEGVFFSTNYITEKILTPTLRVNGKTTSLKNADVYWFLEDAEVKEENKYYSQYGGYGWNC